LPLVVFFNMDVLHYLPSYVLNPACCEPVVYISYGRLGIFFLGGVGGGL